MHDIVLDFGLAHYGSVSSRAACSLLMLIDLLPLWRHFMYTLSRVNDFSYVYSFDPTVSIKQSHQVTYSGVVRA